MENIDWIMAGALWCVVSLLAGILIGSFIRGVQFNAESHWINPDFHIPEFDTLPDRTPAQILKINPTSIGLYKTQYVRKGVTITENKWWAGDFWVDAKDRNMISFIQNRTWEML